MSSESMSPEADSNAMKPKLQSTKTSRRSYACSISFVGTGMKAINKARASSDQTEVERLLRLYPTSTAEIA